ncbi:misacylated tRNA(Ala) deacylase [Devosia subaequoris]|uniref:Alanine--tRNA ligase n=1 Tax=Devosia subaequoris TaxID=395930 RepID=A0A7W6IJC2_9HYPH|nr:alanyl-tRNA editing protein [Devosia subaequoris]MBB4050718.1 misacylated tRNA(Ala) deacylase [Devosia subaequoris]MCP1208602.1 alanyl-tRNA editing protein [Devosia subaequoris]
MTEFLFREDSYLQSTSAQVIEVTADGGVILDRTVFYATSGGQPGDSGRFSRSDGRGGEIATAVHPDGDKSRIVHVLADGSVAPETGETITVEINWDRRYRLMRMHTALHLLSVVFPFPVTGGSIGEDKGRLDFDMPEIPDDLPALEARLNAMIDADHAITAEWITDAEMAAQVDLIKTMKVKPPMGQGKVRLVRIGDVDLQPCGGTHVAGTAEIGRVGLGKIEKKGKQNRRVSLLFA